ncbi:MAG: hypothetical protein JNL66_03040 [Alphaproteobacteria bacterium]|nr:hypothetical protein [Alphaproteobacteria bacterium]
MRTLAPAPDTVFAMADRSRFKKTLSARAALATGVLAALIGWMAVIGLFYVGRVAGNYIEASRSGGSLNQVAPASGPTAPQRP